MNWTQDHPRLLRRDGWTVRKDGTEWVAAFRGATVEGRSFTTSTQARAWVDGNPDAQWFAAQLLRRELKRK